MTAAEIYLIALREAAGFAPPAKCLPMAAPKKTKPKRLAGGCLLYKFPIAKKAKR